MLRRIVIPVALAVLVGPWGTAPARGCYLSPKELASAREKLGDAAHHRQQGRYRAAIRLMLAVKATGCWDAQQSRHLGELYLSAGEHRAAAAALESARQSGIQDIDLLTALARARHQLGEKIAAETALTEAIELRKREAGNSKPTGRLIDPAQARLHVSRGRIRASRGNLEAAVSDLENAVRYDVTNYEAHYWLARALLETLGPEQQKFRRVIDHAVKAYRGEGSQPWAGLLAAQALLEAREACEASALASELVGLGGPRELVPDAQRVRDAAHEACAQ